MTDKTHEHHGDDIGCLEAIEWLYAYLDGEIDDPGLVSQVEFHLDHCRSCFSRSEMERVLAARLRDAGGAQAPNEFRARVDKLLDKL